MSGWRAVAGLITRRRLPTTPALVPGERYVCDLGGPGERLADLELVQVDRWVEAYADGVLHQGMTARFRTPRGDSVEIPREDVLWHRDHHPLIVKAAAVLDVPLVPPRRRPLPQWRVGTARVGSLGMVELGRLLTGQGER
ncbi:hypothetical protein ACIRON_18360 [Nocardioides sp. NPDC101246]|uniref:hypothetical protein n=1 Tax=Nocardioides sp. NPDC101246 TaxID=3364336 RepID=UPI00380C87EA